jgi:hypothetical protein
MRYLITTAVDADMMRFLFERTGLDLRDQHLDGPRWFCATVRDAFDGHVAAAVACEFKSWFDVTATVAVDEPDAISRRLLRGIFRALFSRAVRITLHVEATDSRTEDLARRLGCVYEGFSRRGYDGDRDALVYGMLKEDCRYLPGVRAAHSRGDGPDAPTVTARPLPAGVGPATGQRRERSGVRYH